MTNSDAQSDYTRFGERSQRNRDTRLHEWYLAMVMEDRAETAVPPPELLLQEAGHG